MSKPEHSDAKTDDVRRFAPPATHLHNRYPKDSKFESPPHVGRPAEIWQQVVDIADRDLNPVFGVDSDDKREWWCVECKARVTLLEDFEVVEVADGVWSAISEYGGPEAGHHRDCSHHIKCGDGDG